jgi:hypothetical protein
VVDSVRLAARQGRMASPISGCPCDCLMRDGARYFLGPSFLGTDRVQRSGLRVQRGRDGALVISDRVGRVSTLARLLVSFGKSEARRCHNHSNNSELTEKPQRSDLWHVRGHRVHMSSILVTCPRSHIRGDPEVGRHRQAITNSYQLRR